ncbi:TPA: HNH endonuclease [Klebsiella oxytoca]|nr:HNH endonuclease [Klebsiella oxytoca]
MGKLKLNKNFLTAACIKENVRRYYEEKDSCLSNEITTGNKKSKLIKYELKASSKYYIYVKNIGGNGTNCGMVFYPYNIKEMFSLMKSCEGVAPGKLELHENLNGYPDAGKYIHDSTSPYGFSFLFKDYQALKNFIEQYSNWIIDNRLTFDDICTDIIKDDLLVDILERALKQDKHNDQYQGTSEELKTITSSEKECHTILEEIENSVLREEPDEYMEGEKRLIWSQYYERNRKARDIALSNADYRCHLCCRTMSEIYGDEIDGKETKGLLHAHHIVPISQSDGEQSVNPETDLIAVCPSCHAVLHIGGNKEAIPSERFEELRKRIVANLQNQENVDKMNIAFNEMHKR